MRALNLSDEEFNKIQEVLKIDLKVTLHFVEELDKRLQVLNRSDATASIIEQIQNAKDTIVKQDSLMLSSIIEKLDNSVFYEEKDFEEVKKGDKFILPIPLLEETWEVEMLDPTDDTFCTKDHRWFSCDEVVFVKRGDEIE